MAALEPASHPARATTLAIVSAVFVIAFNGLIAAAVFWAARFERYAYRMIVWKRTLPDPASIWSFAPPCE